MFALHRPKTDVFMMVRERLAPRRLIALSQHMGAGAATAVYGDRNLESNWAKKERFDEVRRSVDYNL